MSARGRKLAMWRGGAPCSATAGRASGFLLLRQFQRSIRATARLLFRRRQGCFVGHGVGRFCRRVGIFPVFERAGSRAQAGARHMGGRIRKASQWRRDHRAADMETPAAGVSSPSSAIFWGGIMAEGERVGPVHDDGLDGLRGEIARCRLCRDMPLKGMADRLPHEPRPVVVMSARARILIAGQAPGCACMKRACHSTMLPATGCASG